MTEREPCTCPRVAEANRLLKGWKPPTGAEFLEARLPEDMKHCTIVFKACAEGHGWLTATNWVQHGCPTCEREDLRAKLAAGRGRGGRLEGEQGRRRRRKREAHRAHAEGGGGSRTLYRGERLVGLMDTQADAAAVVEAMNRGAMKERLEQQAKTLLVRAKLVAAAAIIPDQRRDDDVDAARALIGDILDYQRDVPGGR